MKHLDLNKMNQIQGGGPCGPQIACTFISIGYGLVNPVLGIASSLLCLGVECPSSSNSSRYPSGFSLSRY